MPKVDLAGWTADKTRRTERQAQGLCPMDGQPKRPQDEFCSEACKDAWARGLASKE